MPRNEESRWHLAEWKRKEERIPSTTPSASDMCLHGFRAFAATLSASRFRPHRLR